MFKKVDLSEEPDSVKEVKQFAEKVVNFSSQYGYYQSEKMSYKVK